MIPTWRQVSLFAFPQLYKGHKFLLQRELQAICISLKVCISLQGFSLCFSSKAIAGAAVFQLLPVSALSTLLCSGKQEPASNRALRQVKALCHRPIPSLWHSEGKDMSIDKL